MDLFYYGSQDVPPSSRGRRPGSHPGAGPSVCEACSEPISPGDLEEGRASETYGLSLCGNCRQKASAEDRVELYFCDRCHVSVPVYRVDTGEALAGDGRILCLDCRGRSGRRRSGFGLAILIVLMLAAGAWFGSGMDEPGPPAPAVPEALLARLDATIRDFPHAPDAGAQIRWLIEVSDTISELETACDLTMSELARARASLLRMRVECLRRMEILEGEALSLLREVEDALRAATAER